MVYKVDAEDKALSSTELQEKNGRVRAALAVNMPVLLHNVPSSISWGFTETTAKLIYGNIHAPVQWLGVFNTISSDVQCSPSIVSQMKVFDMPQIV